MVVHFHSRLGAGGVGHLLQGAVLVLSGRGGLFLARILIIQVTVLRSGGVFHQTRRAAGSGHFGFARDSRL